MLNEKWRRGGEGTKERERDLDGPDKEGTHAGHGVKWWWWMKQVCCHIHSIRKDKDEERGGLRGGKRVKGKGRGTGDCRKVSMLGHACPNELIACARAGEGQRGKEKAVIDRDSERERERVSEVERYKTPNTFSIMSPTRLAGHGRDSTRLRQHSNQITRQTELFNCCKCGTLLPPASASAPLASTPWQSLARQIWSHLPFAPGQIVLLHLRNLLIRILWRNFDNQPRPPSCPVLYWISLNSIYICIVCIYFCALKCALNCGAC